MDDLYFRLVFLAVGLLVGWIAGVIQCTKNYAKEARREAHIAKREVLRLEHKLDDSHG